MRCQNCKLNSKYCICEKVDEFFEKAKDTPRKKPSSNVLYIGVQMENGCKVIRNPFGDRTKRLAS